MDNTKGRPDKGSDAAPNQWVRVERDIREKKHAKRVKQYQADLSVYKSNLEDAHAQIDALLGVSEGSVDPKPIQFDKADKAEAVAVVLASDWHVEETVDGYTVNDSNEFNLDIADQRISKLFADIVRLAETERGAARIEDLVLWLGGDMMTGHIHEELAESNGLSPVETVLWLQDRITGGIEALKPHFRRILIPTSFGNHGRDTARKRHSTGAKHSYEWMMYKNLEKITSDSQVVWQVGGGYHTLVDIHGFRVRFHHGDGFKYQGGIGGLTIPVEKAIASWNKSPVVSDLDCFGHYHTYMQSPKWCSNGSLIGYNAYALSIKAAFEPPQQTFFLLDRRYGRTVTCPIVV